MSRKTAKTSTSAWRSGLEESWNSTRFWYCERSSSGAMTTPR